MRKGNIIILFVLFCFSHFAYSQALPVIDFDEIYNTLQLIKRADDQIEQLRNLKESSEEQLKLLKKSISGNFGYGNYLNTEEDETHREWSNDNWIDVLQMREDKKNTQFTDAQKAYQKLYPVTDVDHVRTTLKKDDLIKNYYDQSKAISRAALAASSESYNKINDHNQKIHTMIHLLENQPSEKAAIDLNARLVAELAFIQLEILKEQNIQSQLEATEAQNKINGMSDESQFMKLGNN